MGYEREVGATATACRSAQDAAAHSCGTRRICWAAESPRIGVRRHHFTPIAISGMHTLRSVGLGSAN